MKLKKLLTIGITCVAILGCIFATGCASDTSSENDTTEGIEAIAGQWYTQFQEDDKSIDAILDIGDDGICHSMVLGNTPGIQLTDVTKYEVEKTDDNTYVGKTDKGDFNFTYDAEEDTLTCTDNSRVFTRLDPVVGIWSGVTTTEQDECKITTLIKPDGNGIAYGANNDGTSSALKLTWTKSDDSSYILKFSDGMEVTRTIDESGMTLTSDTGLTLTKQLQSEWYLLSITGTWYNEEGNTAITFNGDGTGFINWNGTVGNFNWEITDVGVFETTLYDCTGPDGTTTAQWTYDREADTLTSSDGLVHTRPAESVDGHFTLK